MTTARIRWLLAACCLLPPCASAAAGEARKAAPQPEAVEFFEKKIRPVLSEQCYGCHNSLGKQKGGLALDHKAAVLAGGDSGPAVLAGMPDDSPLIWAVRHQHGYAMPANAPKLSAAVVHDLETWVRQGAFDPRIEKPTKEELERTPPWEEVREQRRRWWSFQPLREHPIPDTADRAWSESALDRFLVDRMRRDGLTPQPTAPPEVLARRVHLILTGLPPTPAVVEAFVSDPSTAAYRRMVDDLLASPRFGERWARHWMDWYRYAESHGSEGDPPIPHAAQYRDYLIRALNADVPYDRLLREHIAGDLLADPRVNRDLGINESAIGPAQLRMVPHGFGVTDAYGELITFTDNQIDVLTKAMLGLTVSCARCHNHKFDPISQKDFYRFFGILASTRPSSVLIDAADRRTTNKAEIERLKPEIRRAAADYWRKELDQQAVRFDERLDAAAALGQGSSGVKPTLPDDLARKSKDEQAEIRKRHQQELARWNQAAARAASLRESSHPFALWAAASDAAPKQYPAIVARHQAELRQRGEHNARVKREAAFYLDLRDPAVFSRWFSTGNGTADVVSPAGSFALHGVGEHAVAGVYPRGVYSHLISDKHAAVLSSGNFTAQGKRTMIRAAGQEAQVRVPIRNYPLTHGGLHPTVPADSPTLQWQAAQPKWGYWQGEKIHYELRTSLDVIPRPGSSERSWFGAAEVYAGDEPPVSEGASVLALTTDPATIVDRAQLTAAYAAALRQALDHWRDDVCTDQEAEFLDAFLRHGALTNRIADMPESLQGLIADYRRREAAIPIPRRAPGVIDAERVDQPLLVRGEYKQEAKPTPQGFLEIFSDAPYDDVSGRLRLADDMVGPANTLKSRVLVNRLWAYVFGKGLVASTDNFGRLGDEPTHPELLDHLALEFERDGWSIQRALRRMVLSRAFRSVGQSTAESREIDPDNRLLSHFSPRRLDAEAIHDSVQAMAGQRDRAVFAPVVRNRLDPFLAAFNTPVPTSTVSRRDDTNVPDQSLAMMNGPLVQQAAKIWSQQVLADAGLTTPEDRISAMFQQGLARRPTRDELGLLLEHLQSGGGYPEIAHVLLNTKEFVYVP